MRRAFFLFCAALLFADNEKLPEPYRSIAELAQAAPPEFAADALLRIAESGKVTTPETRRDLVEQAFRLASGAKFQVRMRGVPGSTVDTRSGYLSQAYDLKLDVVSLQSRAVLDMAAIDPRKSRELFQELQKPQLSPLTCDDALVYDVADFYRTMLALTSTFTPKEREKEEHLNFLIDYLGQVTSPVQLAPLARVIKGANVTPDQREILWNRFAGLLESLQPDARSSTASAAELGQEAAPMIQASLDKFRQKNTGCKDDVASNVLVNGDPEPPKTAATPKIERYWQSPAAQQLLQQANRLRFTPEGKPYSDADRSSHEWQQQLTDFLSQLAGWTPGQEKSEADFYHQKSVVFEALIELIPPGPQRDKTLEGYLDFITNSNLQQQSPVEWFMHAHSMLERIRTTNTGEPAKLLDAFQRSGNPVLALYAAIEKVFGGKLPSWVTISN